MSRPADSEVVPRSVEEAKTDVTSYPISGMTREGLKRFSMPLITPVVGNLWQGGCINGLELPHDFDFVLSLYDGEEYKLGPDTFRIQVANMPDSHDMESDTFLYKMARVARAFMHSGKTLVHCQAGLNRSGLLAGLVLVLDGFDPAEAIRLLRASRSPAVLCNVRFEEWLLKQPVGGPQRA